MAVNILVFLIIIPLIFGIPILIGIYVYRDSTRRGMNAALWTLIAMCAPSLLGLIIYLLVRPSCTICGTLLQSGWKVCPRCGTDAPEYDYAIATPVKQKNKTLGKILIAILVIPIALILLLFLLAIPLSFNTYIKQSSGYSAGSVTTVPISD